MTTKNDWNFRSAFLTMQADMADKKADHLREEAVRFRDLARTARDMAGFYEQTDNKG